MEEKEICKGNCYGCTACAAICPYDAISMKENEKGFLYPSIDSSLCVDCGLCKKVCAKRNEYNATEVSLIGKHKNKGYI